MRVEVETLPNCISNLKIEVPAEQVKQEWEAIASDFAHHARIPGYRPGKAPKRVVETKFRKEIQDELTKKLVGKSYREAIKSKQLRVVSLTELEDVEFTDDRSMRFRATVVTAPEFELPDYHSIPVQLPSTEVRDEEVNAALERLRDQAGEFIDVPERALAMGDFAVLDFTGTVAGQPISELAPGASKNLHGGKKFWLHLAPENFLPGFCEGLVGQAVGEIRTLRIDFPAEFPVAELAGKTAEYAVTLNEIKQKMLPPLDDEFAGKLVPDKSLAEVRELLSQQIEREKLQGLERAKEAQVIAFLIERVQCELPVELLRDETRRVLANLVQANRERGVPDEALKSNEKELIEVAGRRSHERVKSSFILHRIAEQEKLEVLPEEVEQRIAREAAQFDTTPEKLRKRIIENDQMNGLVDEILLAKTLDLLKSNVSVSPIAEPDASGAPAEPIS